MDKCKVFRNRNKNCQTIPQILCLYGENERLINSKDLTINIKYNQAEDKNIRPGKRCVL